MSYTTADQEGLRRAWRAAMEFSLLLLDEHPCPATEGLRDSVLRLGQQISRLECQSAGGDLMTLGQARVRLSREDVT